MDRTAAFNHGPRRSVSYNAIRTSAGPTVDSMYIAFQFFTDGALLKRLSFSTPVPAGAQQGWTTDDLVDVVRKEIHHLRKHEAFLSRLFGKLEVGLAVVDEYELDPGAETCNCLAAHVRDFEYSWSLTNFIIHPRQPLSIQAGPVHDEHVSPMALLRDCTNRYYYAVDTFDLTIRRVLDKNKVARLVLVLAIIAPFVGLGVGLCGAKAEAAIAVWCGIIGLGVIVLNFVAWY